MVISLSVLPVTLTLRHGPAEREAQNKASEGLHGDYMRVSKD